MASITESQTGRSYANELSVGDGLGLLDALFVLDILLAWLEESQWIEIIIIREEFLVVADAYGWEFDYGPCRNDLTVGKSKGLENLSLERG